MFWFRYSYPVGSQTVQMYIFPTFLVCFFQVISKLSNKPTLSQVCWSHFNYAKLHFHSHSHNYNQNKAWKLLPFLLKNRFQFFQNENLNSILQIVLPLPILWVTASDLFFPGAKFEYPLIATTFLATEIHSYPSQSFEYG